MTLDVKRHPEQVDLKNSGFPTVSWADSVEIIPLAREVSTQSVDRAPASSLDSRRRGQNSRKDQDAFNAPGPNALKWPSPTSRHKTRLQSANEQ